MKMRWARPLIVASWSILLNGLGCSGDEPSSPSEAPAATSSPNPSEPTATHAPDATASDGPVSSPSEAAPTPTGALEPTATHPPNTPAPTAEPAYRCAEVGVEALSLAQLATRFDDEIFPLMSREVGGCAGCHGPESGRLMTMGPTGSDTFYRLRAGGFLAGDGPGSLLDRLRATDATAMPMGGPQWAADEIGLTACLVSDVVAFDLGEILAPDEAFPPNLLEPYAGPAHEGYDNTWLGYDALKGRILTQFGDDWVRDGVDHFAVNIGLFGGVDFEHTFSPVRQPTADYLLGMDLMGRDVCQRAAIDGAGPFAGLDLLAPILEEPPSQLTYFDTLDLDPPSAGDIFDDGDGDPYGYIWANGYMGAEATFPIDGEYTFDVWATGVPAGLEQPHMELRIDGETLAGWDVPVSLDWVKYSATVPVAAGSRYVAIWFTNDFCCVGGDRNLKVDAMAIDGPVPGSTVGAVGAEVETKGRIGALMEGIVFRPAQVSSDEEEGDERAPLYGLLTEMEALDGDRLGAWSAVCELLLKHPDFLFTRPPYFDIAPPAERERLIFLRTALDLLNRPPTADEWARFDGGEPRMAIASEWLESWDFLEAYFLRAQVLFESSGSTTADEPARLMTWMFLAERPIQEMLTAEYTVNAQFQQRERPGYHGPTGALTMPGYIENKPGLPHYNYPARVLSDFMGYVFEVPPEIVDSRAGSTAASTVDPQSVCFSCHQLLTPLAHQRLRWDDDGHYRDVDEDGEPIDDSDRGMVEAYPYPGSGMSAFSAQAVRKERFIRRMINTQVEYLLGRPLRHEADERALYKTLWDVADQGQGSFRDLLEIILESEAYTYPPGGRYEEDGR